MLRHVRLLKALFTARLHDRLAVDDESSLVFRVWPTDVDIAIANHAAVLSVMETGRIDFMIRSGFFQVARRNRWYFPLRSLRVRYLRPLKVFQKAELTTRILHAGDDRIFIRHVIRRRGKDVAIAIAEATVRQGRDPVPLERIAAELGVRDWPRSEHDVDELVKREEPLLHGTANGKP